MNDFASTRARPGGDHRIKTGAVRMESHKILHLFPLRCLFFLIILSKIQILSQKRKTGLESSCF
jgi:hypothetical protein